jgi:hypothetical protein
VAGNWREISSRLESVPDSELEAGTVDEAHFYFCEEAAAMGETEKNIESAARIGVIVRMGDHKCRARTQIDAPGFLLNRYAIHKLEVHRSQNRIVAYTDLEVRTKS